MAVDRGTLRTIQRFSVRSGFSHNLIVLISKARKSNSSALSVTASFEPGSSIRFTSSAAVRGADSCREARVGAPVAS